MNQKKLGTTDVSHALFGVKNHATVSIFFFFIFSNARAELGSWWAGDRERPGRGRGVPDASAVIQSRNSNFGAKLTVQTWRLGRLFFFFFFGIT